jgi:hypothetical protein
MLVIAISGSVWAVYQVLRYDKHPLHYPIMVLLPFAFVWYYIGRYLPRSRRGLGPTLP